MESSAGMASGSGTGPKSFRVSFPGEGNSREYPLPPPRLPSRRSIRGNLTRAQIRDHLIRSGSPNNRVDSPITLDFRSRDYVLMDLAYALLIIILIVILVRVL